MTKPENIIRHSDSIKAQLSLNMQTRVPQQRRGCSMFLHDAGPKQLGENTYYVSSSSSPLPSSTTTVSERACTTHRTKQDSISKERDTTLLTMLCSKYHCLLSDLSLLRNKADCQNLWRWHCFALLLSLRGLVTGISSEKREGREALLGFAFDFRIFQFAQSW